ncbi:MAG: hypothetical protein NTX79_07185 [Candidatus Micrarchaeota archaeon]|nr:hypothetical protein [Candidatus Micrarchaeota archaeon]
MAPTPISPDTQNMLASLTIESLKSHRPDLVEMVQDIVLDLPDEHAEIFGSEESLYSLVKIAEKLGSGSNRKERALARKMGKLFVMCADMGKKSTESQGKNEGKQPLSGRTSLANAAKESGLLSIEGPIQVQNWMLTLNKAKKSQESWKEEIEKMKLAGNESQEKIKAMEFIYKLHDLELREFEKWAKPERILNGRLDEAKVEAYAERLKEGQEYQRSDKNVASVEKLGSKPATETVECALEYIPESRNIEALAALAKEYTFERVVSHNSEDFIKGYALVLRKNFDADVMDPPADLMTMMDDGKTKNTLFKNSAEYAKTTVLSEYYMIQVKDKKGNIIGVCDGNFSASEIYSAMYGAHIAIAPGKRQEGLATLLYAARFALGDKLASEAEAKFHKMGMANVDYSAPIKGREGNKLQHFVIEIDMVNTSSKSAFEETVGRLMFFGKMGVTIKAHEYYSQVDLEGGNQEVPLFCGDVDFRKIGNQNATVRDVKTTSAIMRDNFLVTKLYPEENVCHDYEQSIQVYKNAKDTDLVRRFILPATGTDVERMDAIVRMMQEPGMGFMKDRLANYYKDRYANQLYLEETGGKVVPLEKLREHMLKVFEKKGTLVKAGSDYYSRNIDIEKVAGGDKAELKVLKETRKFYSSYFPESEQIPDSVVSGMAERSANGTLGNSPGNRWFVTSVRDRGRIIGGLSAFYLNTEVGGALFTGFIRVDEKYQGGVAAGKLMDVALESARNEANKNGKTLEFGVAEVETPESAPSLPELAKRLNAYKNQYLVLGSSTGFQHFQPSEDGKPIPLDLIVWPLNKNITHLSKEQVVAMLNGIYSVTYKGISGSRELLGKEIASIPEDGLDLKKITVPPVNKA